MVAYIILDADAEHDVRSTLAELPLVKSGLLDWNVVMLRPLAELATLLDRSGTAPPAWWPA